MSIIQIPIAYEVEGIPRNSRKVKTYTVFDSIDVEILDVDNSRLVAVSGKKVISQNNKTIDYAGYEELYDVNGILCKANLDIKHGRLLEDNQVAFNGNKGPKNTSISEISDMTKEWIKTIPSLKDKPEMIAFKKQSPPVFLMNFTDVNCLGYNKWKEISKGNIANLDDVEQFKTIISDTREAVVAKTRKMISDMGIMAHDGKIFFPTKMPKYGFQEYTSKNNNNNIYHFAINPPGSHNAKVYGIPLSLMTHIDKYVSKFKDDIKTDNMASITKKILSLLTSLKNSQISGDKQYKKLNLLDYLKQNPTKIHFYNEDRNELLEFLTQHGDIFTGIDDETYLFHQEIIDMDFLIANTTEQDIIDSVFFFVKERIEHYKKHETGPLLKLLEDMSEIENTRDSIEYFFNRIDDYIKNTPGDHTHLSYFKKMKYIMDVSLECIEIEQNKLGLSDRKPL